MLSIIDKILKILCPSVILCSIRLSIKYFIRMDVINEVCRRKNCYRSTFPWKILFLIIIRIANDVIDNSL